MDTYKVNILEKILEGMTRNEYYLCRVKGDDTKYINIDDDAVKLLINYYCNRHHDGD